MPLYLSPYTGDGSKKDPYRPRGADGQEFSSLDLRPERDVAVLWVPGAVSDPQLILLGDGPKDSLSALQQSRLTTAMGRTITGATVEDAVYTFAKDVTAKGADSTGKIRVYCGPVAMEVTPIRGGSARLDSAEHLYLWWRTIGATHADALWLAERGRGPLMGGTALATDNFNRANADPISGSWTDLIDSGNWKISTNRAEPSNIFADSGAFYNGITWPNDQYSQVKATATGGGGGGAGIGPLVRGNTPGASRNYYRLVIDDAASNNIELAKRVSGSYTQLWLRTATYAAGVVTYLEAQGTTLIAKVSGSAVGASQTDSEVASGNAGIVYSSSETTASVDDWEGGDFAGGGRTTKNTRAWPLGTEIGMRWRVEV